MIKSGQSLAEKYVTDCKIVIKIILHYKKRAHQEFSSCALAENRLFTCNMIQWLIEDFIND